MSMQELVKIKRYVEEMKIKHAQAITRQQNLEAEFVREWQALQNEYAWAKKLVYNNDIELSTETSEKEYVQWEQTIKSAIEQAQKTLEQVVKDAQIEKETLLNDMKETLRKEGYDV